MISIEHHSDGHLELRVSGMLSRRDYDAAVPEIEHELQLQQGPLRILISLEDFRGWEVGALWDELRFDIRHRADLGRIAVVGESAVQEWGTRLARAFFDNEVRYFERDRIDEARDWLQE